MTMKKSEPPVVCVVGTSGAGKTTLLEKLIPVLTRRGVRVGTLKHDVHGFEIDEPGKDSYRHKHAGATISIISSPRQVAMVMDTDHDLGVGELLPFYSRVDIVLAEGYKRENYPKIEVFRRAVHPAPLCLGDKNLIAVVTDDADALHFSVPRFMSDEIEGLAEFLLEKFLGSGEEIRQRAKS